MPGEHDVWNLVDHLTQSAGAPESDASAPASPRRARRFLPLVAAGTALLLVGGVAVANAHKTVTLDLDGTVTQVGTFAGSVGSLLDAEGVELASRDVVAPGRDSDLSDGDEVVVRVARPLIVTDGEAETTVWTTERTVGDALELLALRGDAATVVASRSDVDGRHGLSLDLTDAGRVHVLADGRLRSIPGALSVAAALERADVVPGEHDRVTIDHGEGATVTVTVRRVEVTQVAEVAEIPFESVVEQTADLYRGQTRLAQEGVPGALTTTFSVVLVDGAEESRRLLGEEVTAEPVTEIVREGTAARPVVVSGPVVEGDVWGQLAQCESGGNPTIVSRNGLYYGLYQFSLATWQSVGGSGLPTEASAEEQTQRAQALQARSGWGQWPACSRSLGLR